MVTFTNDSWGGLEGVVRVIWEGIPHHKMRMRARTSHVEATPPEKKEG